MSSPFDYEHCRICGGDVSEHAQAWARRQIENAICDNPECRRRELVQGHMTTFLLVVSTNVSVAVVRAAERIRAHAAEDLGLIAAESLPAAMTTFLPAATDFTDIARREPAHDYTVECPLCKGHGAWNLTRDAYGPGRHFQAACGQCNGWGYVKAGSIDVTCLHDWQRIASDARGWFTDRCTKCGTRRSGSSDD